MSRSAQEVGPFDPAGLPGVGPPFRAVGDPAAAPGRADVVAPLDALITHSRHSPRVVAAAVDASATDLQKSVTRSPAPDRVIPFFAGLARRLLVGQIAEALNARGINAPRGGQWHATSVRNVMARA
jgi:hypothetical protein